MAQLSFSRRLRCAGTFALLLLFVTAVWAVVRGFPDLSGRWKLDRDRSSGPYLRHAASEMEVTQHGDEVKFVYYSGGAISGSDLFLADGIERDRYTTRIERAYAKVHWRKDELIIITRHVLDAVGYQAYSETDSWLLSEDHQTLTAKLSDGTVLVYEKKSSDSDPAPALDPLKGITQFRAVGLISGTGPCHGVSFEGPLKGEVLGNGTVTFCGPPPQNWGGKPGSCGTQKGTLTFSKDNGGSTFVMNVIGQFCISEGGGNFRGTYEVDKITASGGFLGHINGGSGTVEFSYVSKTVILYGILLQE